MRLLVLGGTSFVGRAIVAGALGYGTELIATCARAAGSQVEVVPVPADAVPDRVPLVWPEARWPTQQRSAARARAAGMPATPLAVTAAEVLAWDRGRGEPPLSHGLSPAEEERLLARA